MKLLLVFLALAQEPTRQEDLEKRVEALEKKQGFQVGSATFTIYGMARLDSIYDDSRPNNTQTIAWIRSEDDGAPTAIRAKDNDEDLTIHPRLTRLGLDAAGPRLETLGQPRVSGKIEIDFYNNGLLGQSESRAAIRMRHAYLKLAGEDGYLLAGQTADIIAPIWPIVNADLVMWNAGNLGDRRPMLMGEYRTGPFTFQGEIGLTGADDNQDLDGDGIRDGEDSGLPTLQARIAFAQPQGLAVGLWAHWAREEVATAIAGEDQFESQAVGVDVTLPITPEIWFKGEAWMGKNLDDIRGGIAQGVNATTGEEVHARGGWVEIGAKPCAWYSAYGGAALDDPDDEDLPPSGRDINRIYYLANRFNLGGNVTVGLDWLHWTTDYVAFDVGTDNRYYFFVQWTF